MDIKELKNKIEDNKLTLSDFPLILKYEDNKFVINQYIDRFCSDNKYEKLYINNLNELNNDADDIFGSNSDKLFIYEIDKLNDYISPEAKNLLVVTKSVGNNQDIDFIEIPKLVEWNIIDYVKLKTPGLSEKNIKWLCESCKYDIYRLDKECNKLNIFPEGSQNDIFEQIKSENGYCDVNQLTIFNFTNAIMKKDLVTVHTVLSNLKWIDIEGTGLITIFRSQFRKLLDIQLNQRSTAESLGMNPKQFLAIKHNVGTYTDQQLIDIYEFIVGLDKRLKNGDFQFKIDNRENNNKFVEFITLNILTIFLKHEL